MEASVIHLRRQPAGGVFGGRLLRLRSDDQLVALFRLGNDDAFTVIHERYGARLLAYMRRMLAGSGADPEDALQDVLVRAYRALRGDDRPVTLRAWLFRVAHNRCIDVLRRPVPAPAEILDVSRGPVIGDPVASAEGREHLRRLVTDVGRLPEQQRSALLLRELHGLSHAELAGVLDVSVPAVKSLLVRARGGLVAADEARDTACSEIRADLAAAADRGVRCNGRARRHLRDCRGCRGFQQAMAPSRSGLGALLPGPFGAVAAALGFGGTGAGAVVGGTAAVKVAAVICTVAVVGGGGAAVHESFSPPATSPAATADAPTPAPAPAPDRVTAAPTDRAPAAIPRRPARRAPASSRPGAAAVPVAVVSDNGLDGLSGGAAAPEPAELAEPLRGGGHGAPPPAEDGDEPSPLRPAADPAPALAPGGPAAPVAGEVAVVQPKAPRRRRPVAPSL